MTIVGERDMKIMYKLTDEDMKTHGEFQWELGKEVRTSGEGDLCGPGWLHCYSDPLVAILLNPIHANISDPRLFRAMVKGKSKHDHGLKSGYTSMTLVEELPVPEITTEQRVRFAIMCSLKVYHDPGYVAWAENWLSGKDRSEAAAQAACAAAEVAWTASWAVGSATQAAWAASWAAGSAAWAAEPALGRSVDIIAIAQKACGAP